MITKIIGNTHFRQEQCICIRSRSCVSIQSTTKFQESHIVDSNVLQEVKSVVSIFQHKIGESLFREVVQGTSSVNTSRTIQSVLSVRSSEELTSQDTYK